MVTFRFRDELLEGLQIKVKIGAEDSISAIIAECVKRVLAIFDQLGLENLILQVKEKHFRIPYKLSELQGEEIVYIIESYEV
tara:strand:- start:385 stop:630 length:246 start_codon:yes stop_codon:yes gene_type:complete